MKYEVHDICRLNIGRILAVASLGHLPGPVDSERRHADCSKLQSRETRENLYGPISSTLIYPTRMPGREDSCSLRCSLALLQSASYKHAYARATHHPLARRVKERKKAVCCWLAPRSLLNLYSQTHTSISLFFSSSNPLASIRRLFVGTKYC